MRRMTDEDVITDLKQFIAATMSQQLSLFRVEVGEDILRLENKIDDLSASVAEAIDDANQRNDKRFGDHEKRLRRLEHKTA